MKNLIYLIVGFVLSATLQAQTLADFARQERERKKGLQSKITITNDSIHTAAVVGIAPVAIVQPAVKEAAAAGPTDRQGRDEKSWRTAFATKRQDLKRAEDQVKVLELKLNQTKQDFLQKSDLFNREQILGAEMTAIQKDLDAASADVGKLRQQLVTMEDDLRRAGGPAGWAR